MQLGQHAYLVEALDNPVQRVRTDMVPVQLLQPILPQVPEGDMYERGRCVQGVQKVPATPAPQVTLKSTARWIRWKGASREAWSVTKCKDVLDKVLRCDKGCLWWQLLTNISI